MNWEIFKFSRDLNSPLFPFLSFYSLLLVSPIQLVSNSTCSLPGYVILCIILNIAHLYRRALSINTLYKILFVLAVKWGKASLIVDYQLFSHSGSCCHFKSTRISLAFLITFGLEWIVVSFDSKGGSWPYADILVEAL